jgi:hypothetical protein
MLLRTSGMRSAWTALRHLWDSTMECTAHSEHTKACLQVAANCCTPHGVKCRVTWCASSGGRLSSAVLLLVLSSMALCGTCGSTQQATGRSE